MTQLVVVLIRLALIFLRALTGAMWEFYVRPHVFRILNALAQAERSLRGPALIIFGALVSTILALHFQGLLSSPRLVVAALMAVAFAFWGMGVVSSIPALQRKMRKGKRIALYFPSVVQAQRQITLIAPRVGILSDMKWKEQSHLTHTGTDVTPEEWKDAIETKAGEENL